MPYSTRSRGFKSAEMTLDDAMKHRWNLVVLANSTCCGGFSMENAEFRLANCGAFLRAQWLQRLESGV